MFVLGFCIKACIKKKPESSIKHHTPIFPQPDAYIPYRGLEDNRWANSTIRHARPRNESNFLTLDIALCFLLICKQYGHSITLFMTIQGSSRKEKCLLPSFDKMITV